MSKLAILYINQPFSILLQIFRWQTITLLIKLSGAYGSIYCVFVNSIFLYFPPEKARFFVRINPQNKESKKILGLFFTLFLAALQDVSLSYRFFLEMRGIGFKFYRKAQQLILEVGFSHNVLITIPANLYIKVLNRKNTKLMVRGFHRHLVHQFANTIRLSRLPNEYTLKGIHYRNVWLKKKPGKQAQQK